jgi:DNA-binding transcriptional ArsR family regulator
VIRIEVPDAALARLRIAHSPLWESLCALVITRMLDPVPFPYRTWAAAVRAELRTPALRPLADWVCSWPTAEIPDFLLVVPSTKSPRLAEELEALRATPAAAVKASLAARPDWDCPAFRKFACAPENSLAWLSDSLDEFWERTLAPHWPRVTGAIEEDILLRGRTTLVEGHDALLSGLHVRLRWAEPVLESDAALLHSFSWPQATAVGLVLVPLLFCRDAAHVARGADGVHAVSYQARGAATLTDSSADWAPAPHRTGTEGLTRLIGPTRAVICTMLRTPMTTTSLASELALAPSTISEHLRALLATGLISRRRVGQRVLYAMSERGVAVVRTLDNATTD